MRMSDSIKKPGPRTDTHYDYTVKRHEPNARQLAYNEREAAAAAAVIAGREHAVDSKCKSTPKQRRVVPAATIRKQERKAYKAQQRRIAALLA